MTDPLPQPPATKPLSIERLRSAFARMLGAPEEAAPPVGDPDAVTPDGIVEALLFVGRPDGAALSAEAIAEVIRDVGPNGVLRIVDRLDEAYARDSAAWRVERSPAGLRMRLAAGLERVADRLSDPVRAAKLSATAVEALAVVAYRQPVTADGVQTLCGRPSGPPLAQLTRLGLVQRSPGTDGAEATYTTTDRLLRTLGLGGLEQLPRLAEVED